MRAHSPFHLQSTFDLSGDQPQAVANLVAGLEAGEHRLTLEGVTGSGKTFTLANVIREWGRPVLVLSHNKTLAAQLFAELKGFFPENAVEFFISYYDYYQPEAYIPQTDTYIEKDASINEQIERYRLAATNSLLGRDDVIIVASVSCIYGLGSPEDYRSMLVDVRPGMEIPRDLVLEKLVAIQYQRNDFEPKPGTFRVRGDSVDVFPSYSTGGIRLEFFGDTIESIKQLEELSGRPLSTLKRAVISPARHFVMPQEKITAAMAAIRAELRDCVREFEQAGKLLEAQRLKQRTDFDMEMLRELGYCNGIENYSRHLSGRDAGAAPACLLDYFDGEFLTVIDESHVTLPQLRAMYNGDQSRKQTLVDWGFRLPSAKDNRPLSFDEFIEHVGNVIFMSATPGPYERQVSDRIVPQVIRPTGLLDPPVEVRPLQSQIDDVMEEIKRTAEQGDRVLVTTLTKRTAEDLTQYLHDAGFRVEYLHSDIDAITRVQTLTRLRQGEFDCLIGINLLREGLDLPEVALVAVLDADKEGFLRSDTALIQTAGRTARHVNGRVILYADKITAAMQNMIDITAERRRCQQLYNTAHGIEPQSVQRSLDDQLKIEIQAGAVEQKVAESAADYDIMTVMAELEREMLAAAEALEFERAAALRDELRELQRLGTSPETTAPPSPAKIRYPMSKNVIKRRAHKAKKRSK